MALVTRTNYQLVNMKTHKHLYERVCNIKNLYLAYKKARKGKTKKDYVVEFDKNIGWNLLQLQKELLNQTYSPKPLVTFILRDPKTRKISKSDFRDRIIHHAIVNILEPILDKGFIYDSCANRIGKGNLFALNRFDEFKRIVSKNNTKCCYVLKADIKHYFEEIDCEVLLEIINKKINDKKLIELIKKILINSTNLSGGGANEKRDAFRKLNLSIFC